MLTRREVVWGLGATIGAGPAWAADPPPVTAGEAAGHHHPPAYPALVAAALSCIETGEACMVHCFDVIQTGDATIVACARSVHAMLGMNGAVLRLASGSGSPGLAAVARAALPIYRECEAECRKHAAKHEACRRCAESCAAMIAAIGQLPA